MTEPWLKIANQMRALAQTGLHFSENPYDLDRYKKLREISEELISAYSGRSPEHINELFGEETGYITPKMDLRAGVFRNDKILLVQERDDGKWSLPGGFADIGDSPSTAIEREVLEESGYVVKASKLVAIFDREHPRHQHSHYEFHCYKTFFLCDICGEGNPEKRVHDFETSAVEFFPINEIPPLSESRVTKKQIEMLFNHNSNRTLAAEFD